MAWSKPYTVNTGSGGDTRYNGFVKTGDNIDDLYVKANLLKVNFLGATAPSSPDEGQLWLDSNDDPPTLKQYHGTAWVAVSSPIPLTAQGHISGLTVTHATDTDHDITIALGKARDDTDAVDMTLEAALTKRADATWAVGSTNGGMATGESLPTSGTIHLWLIKRSDTGVVDTMFNNHATTGLTPTLPTDYDYKRRIASFRTDGSANIINGVQWGTGRRRTFTLNTPIVDVSAASATLDAFLATLSVPTGLNVIAEIATYNTNGVWFSSPLSADLAAAIPIINQNGIPRRILTNTSSQIRYRRAASDTVYIATIGWEDAL